MNDPNTGNLTVRVIKNGKTQEMVLTAMDMVEYQNQGMTEQQVIDRVVKTLAIVINGG